MTSSQVPKPKHKPKRSLELISIPEPCQEPWDEMTVVGDGRRHCDLCMQDVYDLSSMTREAAEALVFESSGRLCVGFYRRRDGTVVTSDCAPVRKRMLRRTAESALSVGARMASVGLSILAALGVARAANADLRTKAKANPSVAKARDLDEVHIDGEIRREAEWPPSSDALLQGQPLWIGGLMVSDEPLD